MKALDLADKANDTNNLCVYLCWAAMAHRGLVQFTLATKRLREAIKAARKIGNRRLERVCLNYLGRTYRNTGKLRLARHHLEIALSIAREIGDIQGEGVDLGAIASVYYDQSNYEKAVQYYEQAIRNLSQIGDRRYVCGHLGDLGNCHICLGNYGDAIRYLEESLQIAETIGSPIALLQARAFLARVYLLSGKMDKALTTIEKTADLGIARHRHFTLLLHGLVLLCMKKNERAKQILSQAVRSAEAILVKNPSYYHARNSKFIASCGLLLLVGEKQRAKQLIVCQRLCDSILAFGASSGTVNDVMRLLNVLSNHDRNKLLSPIMSFLRQH